MQFERDDAAEIEQKVKNLVTVYELPGLAPKIDIQPHIQEAITKVRLSFLCSSLMCQHNVCLCLNCCSYWPVYWQPLPFAPKLLTRDADRTALNSLL